MLARLTALVLLAAGLAVVAGTAQEAAATTFNVTTTADPDPAAGSGSLREAVLQANASPGADTITVPAGTYVIEIDGDAEQEGATGDFDITDSLTIEGAGSGQTIIDAQQLERIFDVPLDGLEITLRGLTVRNGLASSHGGGIRTLSDITLEDVRVLDNHTVDDFGGGLVVQSGKATMTDVVFSGNESTLSGGGVSIFVPAEIEVNVGTFTGNSSGNGGGLSLPGNAVLRNVIVSDNEAGFSGGGMTAGGGQNTVITIEDSVVSGNTAGNRSGGIEASAIDLTITRTEISENFAGVQGGGFTVFGSLDATNVTISGNSTNGSGGGVYNGGPFGGSTRLSYSTIANNRADADADGTGDGGGIYNSTDDAGDFELHNAIVAYNTDPTSDPDCFGKVHLNDRNFISQTSSGCTFTGSSGDFLDVDPLIGPLANFGGLTRTHALLPGSPAIDEGTDCPPPETDQRGFLRPHGDDCDIGAFEGIAPLIWGDNDCSRVVAGEDALPALLFAAGLTPEPVTDCPTVGDPLGGGPSPLIWADVDCSGEVTAQDILPVLEVAASVGPESAAPSQCPAVGEALLFG